MPPVDTRVPLYVGVSTPDIVIVLNDGNQNVYYQVEDGSGGQTISSTVNDGSLGPTASLFVNAPTFFLGAAPGAQVTITDLAASTGYAPGLVGSNGTLIPADLVALLSGDVADDVDAISAGTGIPMPVKPFTGGMLGSVAGTVGLNCQQGDALWSGIVLTANTAFTITGAVFGSVFALAFSSFGGHTVTHPPGTIWPAGTAPVPSGGKDLYVYLVVAESNGVPTEVWANYTQAYA